MIFWSYQVRVAHGHDSYVHWRKPSTNQIAWFGRQTLFLVHNTCIFFKYLFKKSTNTFWKTCSFLGKSWLTLSFTKKHPLIGPNVHYCRAPQKLATEEIYVLRQKYSCTLLRKIFRASLPKKWKKYKSLCSEKGFVDICANLIEKFT